MDKAQKQLHQLVDEILVQTSRGKQSKQLLSKLIEAVTDQPLLLWNSPKIEELAQASLRVLLLDTIADEEQEITWAHKTYAYITQALLLGRERELEHKELFDILKNRVILLHSHDDFFLDTLDYFFFHNTPVTQKTDRRGFILKRIAAMQVQDLHTLETYDKSLKGDAYLLDVERHLLDKYQFLDDELVEAQLLSDTLFKYIWSQYQ